MMMRLLPSGSLMKRRWLLLLDLRIHNMILPLYFRPPHQRLPHPLCRHPRQHQHQHQHQLKTRGDVPMCSDRCSLRQNLSPLLLYIIM